MSLHNAQTPDDVPDYGQEAEDLRLTIQTSANAQHRAEAACDSETLIRILLDSARLGFHVPDRKEQ